MNRHDYENVKIAMQEPDSFVIECFYRSAEDELSKRKISPIRWKGNENEYLLAMCLTDGEPKTFLTKGISVTKVIDANDVLIPEPKIVAVKK